MNGLGQAIPRYDGPKTGVAKSTGPTLLGQATSEVGGAAERLYRLTGIMREFNDGIHGPQPTPPSNNLKSGADISSRAQDLRHATATLHDAISDMEREVERLQAI